MHLVNVIVVSNQKGGIGKTFLSGALAFLLSTDSHTRLPRKNVRKKERVLLVDADFQGDATFLMTRKEQSEFEGRGLFKAMSEEDASSYIYDVNECLSVLPATAKLADFDNVFLLNKDKIVQPAYILERTLSKVRDSYDWIIIDTSPSLSNLKVQALNVSLGGYTNLIIPMQTERFGFDSVLKFVDTLTDVSNYTNPNLRVLGIVPVLTDMGMKVDKEIIREARKLFDELLFETIIKRKSELKKMVDTGFTEHYAYQREALSEYYNFYNEVKQRVEN